MTKIPFIKTYFIHVNGNGEPFAVISTRMSSLFES